VERYAYHIAFENVVHKFPSRKTRSVNEKLEGELETRVHLPTARFALTLLPAPLQNYANISNQNDDDDNNNNNTADG
jgi:hypothetical protein